MIKYILSLMLVFTLAFADNDDHYAHKAYIAKDLSFLHLKKEQKEKVKKILIEHRQNLRELHHLEEKLEWILKKDFTKKSFYKDKFYKNRVEYFKNIAKEEALFFDKIFKVLDKKQRIEFIKHIEEWEID